jgi:hypothetical protein
VTDADDTPLDRLSQSDVEVVRECLTAAVCGPFFPESEFSTLFGLDRNEVAFVLERWPDQEFPQAQDVAVTNTLNHLLFYPHRQWEVWRDFISVAPREVAPVLARWVGETALDVSPDGYLNRMR